MLIGALWLAIALTAMAGWLMRARADQALYAAKSSGRGMYRVAS